MELQDSCISTVPTKAEDGVASTESSVPSKAMLVSKNQKKKSCSWQEFTPWDPDSVRKLSWHSVYEQVGRRKLRHDLIRHGRFTIIVKQRDYSLYKAEYKDAL